MKTIEPMRFADTCPEKITVLSIEKRCQLYSFLARNSQYEQRKNGKFSNKN